LIGDGTGGFIDSLASVRFVGGFPGPGLAIALVDLDGNELADIVQVSADGERVIVALNTSDEVPPTVTSTATPTATPTVTSTVTPTATPPTILEDDGCAIVDPGSRGSATEAAGGFVALALLAMQRRVR